MIKILLNGCNGAMCQVIARLAEQHDEIEIVAGVDKFPESKKNKFPVFKSIHQCNVNVDVIIDFSRPEALPDLIEYAKNNKCGIVIATTGLSEQDYKMIDQACEYIPIFISSNMSIGINLLLDLVQKCSSVLGDKFDIEIIEKHHNRKVDSPSGTALTIAKTINKVFRDSKNFCFGRNPKSGKRNNAEIGIHAIRGGTIVGEHSVLFAGNDEVIEIKHTAQSKDIFAIGAIEAAKFIYQKTPGLYEMQHLSSEKTGVTSIYTSNNQAMINITCQDNHTETMAQIFNSMADLSINIDLISQIQHNNSVNICFTIQEKDIQKAVNALSEIEHVYVRYNAEICKITIEGKGMQTQPGIAAKIFNILADQSIDILATSTSETKISCIIDKNYQKSAIESIIREFEL